MVNTPFLTKRNSKEPLVPKFPPYLLNIALIFATVLLLLSVVHSTKTAIPLEAYPSKVTSSYDVPSSPLAFFIVLSMVSFGIFVPLAFCIAVRNLGFVSCSGPPAFTATVNSLIIRVKILERLASCAPFLCFMFAHLLCPDIFKVFQK